MRKKSKTGILLAGISFLGACLAARGQQGDEREQRIFDLTNQDRIAQGLQPLHWDRPLAAAAAVHVDRMKDQRTLSHQYPGEPDLQARAAQAGAHFQAIAENIAMGPSAEAIEKQWMNSVPHRQNILDPQMNAIGIAVVEKDGYLYAVEDFASANQALSREEVEQKVGELLRQQKIDPSAPAKIGEEACEMQDGIPADASQAGQVKAVMRFQTPDLSKLPDQVMQQLSSGQFTRASAGACKPEGTFTTYRVALVLY
jgi:Cysteine-rich secretory protein family